MANKALFKNSKNTLPQTDTVNRSGGRAYNMTDTNALCQYVVTGTFGDVYTLSAEAQLLDIQKRLQNVSSEFVAKLAVYGQESAHMKDMSAYMLAVLAARGEIDLLRKVFGRVITNMKMLCNFVQIVRSGQTGRRSFGTAVKSLIQDWINSQDASKLFNSSIGHSNPSLVDIIKMVHPKPRTKAHEAVFGYLLGKKYNKRYLPSNIKKFEAFKANPTKELPDVPFRALTNCKLTPEHWREIGRQMSWNTLRMNLNVLSRNNAFKDDAFTKYVVNKLKDEHSVLQSGVLPYQILTTYQNIKDEIPNSIGVALQDALDISTYNVPSIDGKIALCIDISGSMLSPITGHRGSVTTKTKFVDVAGLMAACVLRQNPDADVLCFDTSVYNVKLNPRDSVMTNASKLSKFGGGTDCSAPLTHLCDTRQKVDIIIMISDNQSWFNNTSISNAATRTQKAWAELKKRNPKAKLVCVDIAPFANTQLVNSTDVINIGGFSDAIFDIIATFAKGRAKADFAKIIENVVI